MPARRVRWRYLEILVSGELDYAAGEIADAVQRGVLSLHGVKGLSKIEPALIEFDEDGQKGIIRCNHLYQRKLRAAITLITTIKESAAAIRVARVSGTIKGLRSKGKKRDG